MKVCRKKGVWTLALAFALALVSLLSGVQKMSAAGAVEVDRECSITFKLENVEAEYTELAGLEIPVRIYRVADMDASGNYTPCTGYEELDFAGADEHTTAEFWQQMAQAADNIVQSAAMDPEKEIVLNKADAAQDTISGLSAGMYLVKAESVASPEYSYAFTPYLISLPNNYYYETQDDAWVYDVTADLKPDQSVRYGDLEIIKELTSYNQSLGDAYFVFQVEAEKDGKSVYSDAVAINFNAPGQKRVLVQHIPAGAQVTVTEAYSGGSYQTVGAQSQQVTVIADEDAQNPVSVTFKNAYDGRTNNSLGVVNHFTYTDGTWDVEQQTDNTQQ